MPVFVLGFLCFAAGAVTGCKRAPAGTSNASAAASAISSSQSAAAMGALPTTRLSWTAPEGPALGIIAGQANVFAHPNSEASRLGYARLGAMLKRDPEPVNRAGCPGGWYRVQPKGYVCAGEEATLDLATPLLRAGAELRPNRAAVLPYRYGFVRAVSPLYLKVPSRDEQLAAEFKLKEHLDVWTSQGADLNKVSLGADDVPTDGRGVPIVSKKVGEISHPSTAWGQGELFGGRSDNDPIPFWLEGGRKIPNVSDFKVPDYAVFADRARRHTGLAFVGSFPTGPASLDRRFAVTTDLRLAPTSKVKPDPGSSFHGLELLDPAKSPPLPFAFVRVSEAKAWKFDEGDTPKAKGALEKRSIVLLTGKRRKGHDGFYWEMKNGTYLRATEAGVVRVPDEWPEAAKKGAKWLEVSIESQSLTLWEGQKPVYATLVSTGQDGMKDPKTTKSTIRGTFPIRSKHITATMDSNERSGAGGGKRPEVASVAKKNTEKSEKSDERPARANRTAESTTSETKTETSSSPRDAEYGVTKRRGEGTFWLRDVPYVQYFEAGYALHVAYWHDVFGVARSHGCINLAPVDGRWIFQWTDPPVPEGWHGVVSGTETGEGTTIVVHE